MPLDFPMVPDSLTGFLNRAINIPLLSFSISFIRKITRGERVARHILRYAMGQSVDSIGEIHAGVVAAVD